MKNPLADILKSKPEMKSKVYDSLLGALRESLGKDADPAVIDRVGRALMLGLEKGDPAFLDEAEAVVQAKFGNTKMRGKDAVGNFIRNALFMALGEVVKLAVPMLP